MNWALSCSFNGQRYQCGATLKLNKPYTELDIRKHSFLVHVVSVQTPGKMESRCRRWVINSRRKDLLPKKTSVLHRSYVFCANHFEASQFMNAQKKDRLIWCAIPTRFEVPNPPPRKRPAPRERPFLKEPNQKRVRKACNKKATEVEENTRCKMSSKIVEVDAQHVRKYFFDHLSDFMLALENALEGFSERTGAVIQPVRGSVTVEKHEGLLLSMPGYSSKDDALSTKIVTVYPKNADKGLPVVQSAVLVFNSKTGSLKALVDGNTLTALRTAAVSAIATKYLAAKDATTLALIGSGTQARSHFEILSKLYKFSEVKVWNIHKSSAEKLVKEITDQGFNAVLCASVEDAVRNADVIVVATLSIKPLVFASWVKPGAHINAVGACCPDWQEIDPVLMNSAVVCVDSRDAAKVEAGDIILSKAQIHAELGEIIAGEKEPCRQKITIFKSLGMAIEDTVTAELACKFFQDDK